MSPATSDFLGPFWGGEWTKWVYPPFFQTKVGGGKIQTSSPPVITPNRSQSNPDDMITLPRPIQSVGMDLHDVSGTSTSQTLPRERRAQPGTHFVRQFGGYTHILLLFLSSTHYCPLFHPLLSEIYPFLTTLRLSKGGLKRQSLLVSTWIINDLWYWGKSRTGAEVNNSFTSIKAASCSGPQWFRNVFKFATNLRVR